MFLIAFRGKRTAAGQRYFISIIISYSAFCSILQCSQITNISVEFLNAQRCSS